MSTLSANITRHQRASGLSVEAYARHIDVASRTLRYWMNGEWEPNLASLRRLARYIGVSVGDLMEGDVT
jgi:transcriptional regulator with XRE-family HTH domain